MNQALHIFGQSFHIFRKDARRFWPQILVVAALFAIYAILSPETTISGMTSLLEWGSLLTILIVLACWTLTASVIHADAPAQGSPFWVTRPYSRKSLLAAKVLFLFAFVFLPLALAGAVLEARSGVNVLAHSGTLLGLCIVRSGWLILPALVLSAVTRNLTEFAGVVCALILVLAIAESRVTGEWMDLLSTAQVWYGTNVLAILPMILAAIGALVFQYATRRTQWSRRLLMVAVIGSGLLMPQEGVALFSVRAMNPGLHTDGMQLAFDQSKPPQTVMQRMTARAPSPSPGPCFSLAIREEGVGAGTALRPLRAEASLNGDQSGDHKARPAMLEEAEGGYRETVCDWLPRETSVTLRTSVYFAVLSVSQIASIPVRPGVLDAGGAGRCEIVMQFPNSQLRCNLAEPIAGSITAGLGYPGFKGSSKGFGDSGFIRLSPVSRQKFDGVTVDARGGWPFEEALKHSDARFVLRTERVIGFLRRDLEYRNLVSPWMMLRPPRPPVKGKR